MFAVLAKSMGESSTLFVQPIVTAKVEWKKMLAEPRASAHGHKGKTWKKS